MSIETIFNPGSPQKTEKIVRLDPGKGRSGLNLPAQRWPQADDRQQDRIGQETAREWRVEHMSANWSGSDRVYYLHADAASNYEALYRHQPGIKPVNCWAHARRKFYAIAGESPTRIFAHDAVEQIDVLFACERAMPAGIWAAVLVAKNGCYRRGRGGF